MLTMVLHFDCAQTCNSLFKIHLQKKNTLIEQSNKKLATSSIPLAGNFWKKILEKKKKGLLPT